jgi:hypothetical protein
VALLPLAVTSILSVFASVMLSFRVKINAINVGAVFLQAIHYKIAGCT